MSAVNKIRVMSREEIGRADFRRPVAVISVRGPKGPVATFPKGAGVVDVLRLEFDDVDDPREGAAMTDDQARQVLEFAARHLAAGIAIVCQCEAGVSRSAGIAAALSRIHFGHDGEFHRTHRPNAWVRRVLLGAARRRAGIAEASRSAAPSAIPDERSKAIFLPTSIPDLILVRNGLKYRWTPAQSRVYPPGTLGGDERTLAARVFALLRRKDGRKWDASAVGAWARQMLLDGPTAGTFVVTRAGAWHRVSAGVLPVGIEPALEIYAQIHGDLSREAWTRALRSFSEALGRRWQQERVDLVLTEDGLMYKRAVWRSPDGASDEGP